MSVSDQVCGRHSFVSIYYESVQGQEFRLKKTSAAVKWVAFQLSESPLKMSADTIVIRLKRV